MIKRSTNNYLRSKARVRKIRRTKRKVKLKNRIRGKAKHNKDLQFSTNKYNRKFENIIIDAGTSFSLFSNPESVVMVIEKLDKCKNRHKNFHNIQIDLSKIKDIDLGAISILLAKIHELTKNIKRSRIWGTMPNDAKCKDVFVKSGFLESMLNLSGNKFKRTSDNYIYKVGSDKTLNRVVGEMIENAVKYVSGSADNYPPVYSIVQEMCANSVEWANDPKGKNRNWFISVSYSLDDKGEKTVTFIMVDIGQGILHTLLRRHHDFIFSTLGIKDEVEILDNAFDQKYGSKTREINRNKGLPLIKNTFLKEQILNLCVMTNNVYLQFGNDDSRKLSKNVPGTFYKWKLNLKCIEKWKANQKIRG